MFITFGDVLARPGGGEWSDRAHTQGSLSLSEVALWMKDIMLTNQNWTLLNLKERETQQCDKWLWVFLGCE